MNVLANDTVLTKCIEAFMGNLSLLQFIMVCVSIKKKKLPHGR